MYKIISMQLEKGATKKQFLKNGLEWNLIMKKIQETIPTHLDQHTEGCNRIKVILNSLCLLDE